MVAIRQLEAWVSTSITRKNEHSQKKEEKIKDKQQFCKKWSSRFDEKSSQHFPDTILTAILFTYVHIHICILVDKVGPWFLDTAVLSNSADGIAKSKSLSWSWTKSIWHGSNNRSNILKHTRYQFFRFYDVGPNRFDTTATRIQVVRIYLGALWLKKELPFKAHSAANI